MHNKYLQKLLLALFLVLTVVPCIIMLDKIIYNDRQYLLRTISCAKERVWDGTVKNLLRAISCSTKECVWDGTVNTSWYKETKNEFTIKTAEQLAGLAELVNNGNSFQEKTIVLGKNIILNDTANWPNWVNKPPTNKWTPIGKRREYFFSNTNDSSFCGTFDGNGFSISGVYTDSANALGLFGYVDSTGIIKNIGITASYIAGDMYIGAIVAINDGKIDNSYSTAWVSGQSYAGGDRFVF